MDVRTRRCLVGAVATVVGGDLHTRGGVRVRHRAPASHTHHHHHYSATTTSPPPVVPHDRREHVHPSLRCRVRSSLQTDDTRLTVSMTTMQKHTKVSAWLRSILPTGPSILPSHPLNVTTGDLYIQSSL